MMSPASSHIKGRQALAEAWPRVTGREATLAELQIAGAMGHLESGYGMAAYKNQVTGETAVLNNWGAVQAGPPPCNPATSFEVTDTHADGTKYNRCFRRYATPAEGAAHMVEHLTTKRPASWEAMRMGDIDGFSRAAHSYKTDAEGYHIDANGNRTENINAFVRNLDPTTGVAGYFEQTPLLGKNSRAHGLDIRIQEIAAALGEPIAAKRGGPVSDGGPSGNPWFDTIGNVLPVILIALLVGGGAYLATTPKALALILRTVAR